jgi:hypothetical protein
VERTLRADAADVLAGVGRHWGWVLAFVAALAADDKTGATRVLLALLGCCRSSSGCTPCGTFW